MIIIQVLILKLVSTSGITGNLPFWKIQLALSLNVSIQYFCSNGSFSGQL